MTTIPNRPAGTDRRSIASINGDIDAIAEVINKGLLDESSILDLSLGTEQFKPQVETMTSAAGQAWGSNLAAGQEEYKTMPTFSSASPCFVLMAACVDLGVASFFLTDKVTLAQVSFRDGTAGADVISLRQHLDANMNVSRPVTLIGGIAMAPGVHSPTFVVKNVSSGANPGMYAYGLAFVAMSFGVVSI